MSGGETPGYEPVLASHELESGKARACTVRGWPVLLARTASGLHAILDRCSHAGSPLAHGRIRGDTIICPLHGARFDLRDGACLSAEPYAGIRTFPVRERAGRIALQVPGRPPAEDELPIAAA